MFSGYNVVGRAGIYLGTTLGAATPIIIGKYFFDGVYPENVSGEVLSWASSIALNFTPSLFGKMPAPFYTGVVGFMGGVRTANKFFKSKESELEKITKNKSF